MEVHNMWKYFKHSFFRNLYELVYLTVKYQHSSGWNEEKVQETLTEI
jgi:hypothetical protein